MISNKKINVFKLIIMICTTIDAFIQSIAFNMGLVTYVYILQDSNIVDLSLVSGHIRNLKKNMN